MAEAKPVEPVDQQKQIEARIAPLTNRDVVVKASYSELRNFHSIICNDIKAAIAKKLAKVLIPLEAVNAENLKVRLQKKDPRQLAVEGGLNQALEAMPEPSPQNMAGLSHALRELLPALIKLQGHRCALLKAEKKQKRINVLDSEIGIIEWLSYQLHQIYDAMVQYGYFENLLMTLIRSRFNRDDIRELVRETHAVLKEAFKLAKNEELEVNQLRLIGLLTQRIVIRLVVYEACDQHTTYTGMLKNLPRLLVMQFNRRYFARRRDSGKNKEELKKTTEYQVMTKKFLTLKLKKFYELKRVYVTHMGRLFAFEDQLHKEFSALLEIIGDRSRIRERVEAIDALQHIQDEKTRFLHRVISSLPPNDDLAKNSLNTIFGYTLNFYINVLADTFAPATAQELALRYIKQFKPSKELMLTADELKFLGSDAFKREEAVLEVYFEGIMRMVRGEEDERPVMEALMSAIGAEYDRSRKDEMRLKTVNRFLAAISPEEIDLLVTIVGSLPPNRERVGMPLGKLYLEVADQYPGHVKKLVSYAEKIEPTDAAAEKLRKATIAKFNQLLLKAVEPKVDWTAPIEALKQAQQAEQNTLKALAEWDELLADYLNTQLITAWKRETARTVTALFIGERESDIPAHRFRELDRHELKLATRFFNSEHLGEIEKHYKALNETIDARYLRHPKPYLKLEYILLFIGKQLVQGFRNPAKSYPRIWERMSSLSR